MDRDSIAKELLVIGSILAGAGRARIAFEEPVQLFTETLGDDAPSVLNALGYNQGDVSYFSDENPMVLKVGDSEWHGFESEEDAIRHLEQHVSQHPENFSYEFLFEHVDPEKAKAFFTDADDYRFVHGDEQTADVIINNRLLNPNNAAKALLHKGVMVNNSRWFRMS